MAPSDLAVPGSQEATEKPGGGQIRIEHDGPVEQRDAAIEITREVGERMAAPRERNRVVSAQLDGAPGQSSTLRDSGRAIRHPAVDPSPEVAPCGHSMRRCEFGVELDGSVEHRQRFLDRLPVSPV